MQNSFQNIAATTQVQPPAPQELVTDKTLRDLADGGPERAVGEISPEQTAQLVMILPEICGELIARRAAMQTEGAH